MKAAAGAEILNDVGKHEAEEDEKVETGASRSRMKMRAAIAKGTIARSFTAFMTAAHEPGHELHSDIFRKRREEPEAREIGSTAAASSGSSNALGTGRWDHGSNDDSNGSGATDEIQPGRRVRRTTIFNAQAQQALLVEDTGIIALLQNYALQGGALIFFVGISANENIVKALSKERLSGPDQRSSFPYSVSSLVFVASLLSIAISLGFASLAGDSAARRHNIAQCLEWRPTFRMAPVSFLFTLAQVLKFKGLIYMPPDMVVLLDQMQLLLLALASYLIMGKEYSKVQIMALAMVALSMIQYIGLRDEQKTQVDVKNPTDISQNLIIGSGIMLLQCIFSTLACVLCEHQLKSGDGASVPYFVQKCRMEVSGAFFALLYCFVIDPLQTGSEIVWEPPAFLFNGWSWKAFLVLLMFMIKVWLSTWISKILDSIVKQVASCAALIVVYVEMLFIDPANGHYDYNTLVSLVNVSLAIVSFAVAAQYTSEMKAKVNRLKAEKTKIELGRVGEAS